MNKFLLVVTRAVVVTEDNDVMESDILGELGGFRDQEGVYSLRRWIFYRLILVIFRLSVFGFDFF